MTGAELAAARRRAGLSQAGLGARAGVGRQAVSYWECKRWVDANQHAPRLMLAELRALGVLPDKGDHYARTRVGVLGHRMAWMRQYEARVLAEAQARWAARAAARLALSGVTANWSGGDMRIWPPC